jgi:hypothetical protein
MYNRSKNHRFVDSFFNIIGRFFRCTLFLFLYLESLLAITITKRANESSLVSQSQSDMCAVHNLYIVRLLRTCRFHKILNGETK